MDEQDVEPRDQRASEEHRRQDGGMTGEAMTVLGLDQSRKSAGTGGPQTERYSGEAGKYSGCFAASKRSPSA
jgi:hypothetical protein